MAAKKLSIADLLAQYGLDAVSGVKQFGRNIVSDAPVAGRHILSDLQALPDMAAAGNRAMLGATQRISDMLPPILQMPSMPSYRPNIDKAVAAVRGAGSLGNDIVHGTTQRALDALGAPRGEGYDMGDTRLSQALGSAINTGVQALPQQVYQHPLDTTYELAKMFPNVPLGAMAKGVGALRGAGRVPAAVAAAEDAAAAPQGMLALPAPPRQLALPAPGPGLPPGAAKLRGGQWWADQPFSGVNYSPEAAARSNARPFMDRSFVWNEPPRNGGRHSYAPTPASQWLEKALSKYYKNEMGTPEDPLRSLAERGLHYDTEMTPERWQKTVNDVLQEDTIGSVLLPRNPKGGMPGAGDDLRGEAMVAMPWLAKQPVTDNIYGIYEGGLDLGHFEDEFQNALDPASGLPINLAVRPESLGRMTFPQAVEHVGKINQYRAKEMERAALSRASNPAVQTFKEYAENNPRGLRWAELKSPELNDNLLSDTDRSLMDLTVKEGRTTDPAALEMVRKERAKTALQDALKYEGDTMGHCVGGYCDDVASGKSRIFSLRDAKGEPHVTIETSPVYKRTAAVEHLQQLGVLPEWQNYIKRVNTRGVDTLALSDAWLRERGLPPVEYSGQDIVQIKGKQNRKPNEDYLPFVQDFVKSQKWGNVGDLGNTGLVKLPDERYITQQQFDEGSNSLIRATYPGLAEEEYANFAPDLRPKVYNIADWGADADGDWKKHFEGYAIGGRVSADRCFSRHPMSVR